MDTVWFIGVLILSYLIGSIPFGLVSVRVISGKDVRTVASGRTGGTNAMRAAGFPAGLATTVLDILKGAVVVWIARLVDPGNAWLHVLAPIAAIIGHNYSIYLLERDERGVPRLGGGAGGAPTVGGAIGLWFPSILFTIPIGAIILWGVGYASVATMSVALVAMLVFAFKALIGTSPWEYVLYGLLAEILLIIALRPNISRLLKGEERLVGRRAKRQKEGERG